MSIAVVLGSTLVLSLGWMWLHAKTGNDPYVDSFSLMPVFVGWLLSLHYTSLKGRSAAAQAIFIGGSIVMLAALFGVVGWITARI